MRFIFLALLLHLSSQAQTQHGKIDMHGGKEEPLYEKKSGFKNAIFGKAAFIESNATKKSLPTHKK